MRSTRVKKFQDRILTLWILHILQMLCFRFLPTLGWETKHWEGQKWGWIEIEWSAWKRSNIFTASFLFKNQFRWTKFDRKYTGSDDLIKHFPVIRALWSRSQNFPDIIIIETRNSRSEAQNCSSFSPSG